MNFITDVVERFPSARPALLAIDAEGERRVWHFGELFAMSAGLSGALAARGVGRGDVVMTLMGSRVEWVLAMLACWRMGAVALPCNPQLRRGDLKLRVDATEPRICIGDEDLLGEMSDGVACLGLEELDRILDEDHRQEPPAEAVELGEDEPAVIIFTSGTTGEPRGAVYAQRYLAGQRLQAEHWFGAQQGDLAWCTAAPGWSKSTRNAFIAPWLRGAAAVIHDGRFDPEERWRLVEREGVSVLCQAPTEYRMLAKRAELGPAPALRRMVSAGEPLNPEVIRLFRERVGIPIHDGYGQTETGAITGMRPGDSDPAKDGSMGRPLPGVETRVVAGEDGDTESADGTGELQVRPATDPTFFSRYLGEEPFDGEWWRTGDRVRVDEDGYLWFEGRDDDIIVTAGYRVGPFEVESALVSHPAVAEAAAVAAPDPERGSVIRAIVVLREGEPSERLASELQDHVKSVTAPYKYPRIVEFAPELPKTPSGKIKRSELRGG
ncbi:MAG: AMP-binding protein [Actinobacteria bacterium]|nr:AMP-binding protein [Actinomycetota bacterium]